MNILEQIVTKTRERVEDRKRTLPLEQLRARLSPKANPLSFEKALEGKDIAFICEVKKASPSKGLIAEDFPYRQIAMEYERAGAAAISVLTEPDFFQGSDAYLEEIRQAVSLPLLRKDFTIDEYQIVEAAALGADAVLLICAILSPAQLREYRELADSLGLSALVEAHDEQEVAMAVKAGARVIGVNNRDLKTFQVDIGNSIRLRSLAPPSVRFVSESGISSPEDIRRLRENAVSAVLIGETLMRSPDKAGMLAYLRGKREAES